MSPLFLSRHSHLVRLLFGALLLAALGFGISMLFDATRAENTIQHMPPNRAEIRGEYVCLPHKDVSGPQTDECAIGIHAENGEYFGLDFGPLQSMEVSSTLRVGERIRVDGVLVPIEQISTDHWDIYPIKGIMAVTGLSRI